MGDILTREEMEKRFDGEWVLVGDPELNETNEVLRGEVLWHNRDRDALYRRALELKPPSSAILCFKKIPDDVVIIL